MSANCKAHRKVDISKWKKMYIRNDRVEMIPETQCPLSKSSTIEMRCGVEGSNLCMTSRTFQQ